MVLSNSGASLTHITFCRHVITIEHRLLSAVFVALWLVLSFGESKNFIRFSLRRVNKTVHELKPNIL